MKPQRVIGGCGIESIDVDHFEKLSARESQVLSMAAEGLRDKEISARLGVSLNTLRTYWTRIRRKVGDASRTALATAFLESRKALTWLPLAGGDGADWVVDLAAETITHLTQDPNAPEIPVGVARSVNEALGTFHPDDAPGVRTALRGIAEGSLSAFAYTARRITSRGLVLSSAFVQVVRDLKGRPVKIYGKRMTPMDARGSGEVGGAAAGTWSRDLRTGELWVDEGFKKIFGLTGDEPDVRAAILARNHPDDRAMASNYAAEMVQGGYSHSRKTFRFMDDDGNYRWASAEIYLEFGQSGPSIAHGIVLVYPRG